MERIANKVWQPMTCDEDYKWPFDVEHFGYDVEDYMNEVCKMFITVKESGEGEWSLGVLSGTLKVLPGLQGNYNNQFTGVMTVSETDEQRKSCMGWRANLKIKPIPGTHHTKIEVTWSWLNGPTKGTPTITYWEEMTESNHFSSVRPMKSCSIM